MSKRFCRVALVVVATLFSISGALAETTQAKLSSKPVPGKKLHSSKPVAANSKANHASKAAADKTKVTPAAKPHLIVIQVDQNDPAVMNLALNNATNMIEYYRAKGRDVQIDLVTFGPGLHMLRDDSSPVKERIKRLKEAAFPSTVQFSACTNTKENMEKQERESRSTLYPKLSSFHQVSFI